MELLYCEYFIEVHHGPLCEYRTLTPKDEWRATYSVYNMNNTKHTSSTDKAEISFLKATFQFIQPSMPNMFKKDISVRTT